jgi:NAD(P)-dependent dehydrogenase (short-subunit alcohol dehydrogenase family)
MDSQAEKVVIVTGASQGIGAGLVAAYCKLGFRVVATSRHIEPSTDPDVLTIRGDIAEPATAERVITAGLERFGRIDTLVNNAGVFIAKPLQAPREETTAAVEAALSIGYRLIRHNGRLLQRARSRPGDAPLALSTGTLRYPQLRAPATDRQELRHLRSRTQRLRTCRDQLTRHRSTRRARPGQASPSRRLADRFRTRNWKRIVEVIRSRPEDLHGPERILCTAQTSLRKGRVEPGLE